MTATIHTPVLVREVLESLAPRDGGRYLDATLGLGGHAEAILRAANCSLLGLDRDTEALALAEERLRPFGPRFHTAHALFADFAIPLSALGWETVDGVLADIGVSSLQLDRRARGFSFRADAPLDMRMDQGADVPTAADIVNTAQAETLLDCLRRYGEEPMAERITREIVAERRLRPIRTTGDLAKLVARAYPKAWRAKSRHNPATRTFQALRILVNDELGQLERFLSHILSCLAVGGRLLIITFHSLEDRLVKKTLQTWAKGCLCPPSTPTCVCGHIPQARLLYTKPRTASAAECAANPRATSAKLRAIEKLAGTRENERYASDFRHCPTQGQVQGPSE